MNCPTCTKRVRGDVRTCKHCGAVLHKSLTPWIVGAVVSVFVLAGSASAAIVLPRMAEARKLGNESAAIGALRTITTAQSLFREGDKEEDTNFDYGDLTELAEAGLIDPSLGSGAKQGYVFECRFSPFTSEFLWYATASPEDPGASGDRYFAVNQSGVAITSPEPIEVDPHTCEFSGKDLTCVGTDRAYEGPRRGY